MTKSKSTLWRALKQRPSAEKQFWFLNSIEILFWTRKRKASLCFAPHLQWKTKLSHEHPIGDYFYKCKFQEVISLWKIGEKRTSIRLILVLACLHGWDCCWTLCRFELQKKPNAERFQSHRHRHLRLHWCHHWPFLRWVVGHWNYR